LRKFDPKWPDFALAVTEAIRSRGLEMVQELGPCRAEEFSPVVQQFLTAKLLPSLTANEKARLRDAEGRWPDYPQTLLSLAEQHGLVVPGVAPPVVRELMERLRFAVTQLPTEVFQDFVLPYILPQQARSSPRPAQESRPTGGAPSWAGSPEPAWGSIILFGVTAKEDSGSVVGRLS
jgi:hypothetical protein